jgi:hypothetical protein
MYSLLVYVTDLRGTVAVGRLIVGYFDLVNFKTSTNWHVISRPEPPGCLLPSYRKPSRQIHGLRALESRD